MRILWKLDMPADCEGRTSHTVGYFTDERVAVLVGKKSYGNKSMGPCDGFVRPIEVFDSLVDFEDNRIDAVRKRALAKLTVTERKALGFE
jgi:hypothetical protein